MVMPLVAAKTKSIYGQIVEESKKIGAQNGTTFSFVETNIHLPALTDPRFQKVITDAAKGLGLSTRLMPSGAGHDAMIMAEKVPSAMIFLRSPGGLSHHPGESVREEDVEKAIRAGVAMLADLATQFQGTT